MNTPKLRFKEFPDKLRELQLENLGEVSRGKFTPRPRNDPRYFLNGTTPFIQTGDIVKAPLYIDKYSQFLNEEGVKVSKIFNAGTVFVTIAANIGDVAVAKESVACTDSVVGIYPHKDKTISLWLKYYLDTKKNELDSKATQNAQKNINLQVLRPLKVFLPSLKEQHKIASFLSAVDQKICLLTKKYELLTTYKKGVMQKIFNQEIRFKDDAGNDYPSWKKKTLAELTLFIGSGGTPKSTTAEYYNGNIPWVSIADMTKQGKYINFTQKNITKLGIENSSARLFPKGTILYAMYASIGEVSIANVDCATSQAILGITINPECLNNFYLFHWLVFMKDKVVLMGQQGTQANLNLDIVKKFQVPVPSIDEQKKIALMLSALDDKISNVQSQIDLTKQYKQGLLQQMFI